MRWLDLNCDLGEGEPRQRTRALMRWITSANVACGGHAGDLQSMRACVALVQQRQIRLGAHPGLWNRRNFGRGHVRLSEPDLELLLLHQVTALERVAAEMGVRLHHIKLHGSLYHAVESDPRMASCYVRTVRHWWPRAKLYARAGGIVAPLARRTGLHVWEEVFADRAYRDDGTLVPRSQPGAVLAEAKQVRARMQTLAHTGMVMTITGRELDLRPQTICLHADTPHAVRLAGIVAQLLRR